MDIKKAVKYCKIVILLYFSERGSYEYWGINIRFHRDQLTGVKNVHTKFQVPRTSGSLFLYCRILHNCYFLYFFFLGFYKNWGIDMKFCMDKLAWVKHVHTKFQVSWISGSWFSYIKILIFCTFLSLVDKRIETLAWNLTWQI